MGDPPPATASKPCCVCAEPGGKHCTKCKSRHYCSKKCQIFDWKEGGHKEQCKQMAPALQDRLLDSLMPLKLKIKEKPAIVAEVAPASGFKALPRLPAGRAEKTAVVKADSRASAVRADVAVVPVPAATPDWRGTCPICCHLFSVDGSAKVYCECCCQSVCAECTRKCLQIDRRCPLCRAPRYDSYSEWRRRIQTQVDKGNATAQTYLGDAHRLGKYGLAQSSKQAARLYERAAVQGHVLAQNALGDSYLRGDGVAMNQETAAMWFRRAAEQGYHGAQFNLANLFVQGKGVAQSYDEAVLWYQRAAAQGLPDAYLELGGCYVNALGVPRDCAKALRLFKRAAAMGHAGAAGAVDELEAMLASTRPR